MQNAVVIGIDRVRSGLTPLRAAASGAREVADWLSRNDYNVSLFTDENGPVERRDIFRRMEEIVGAANSRRLVVYFAGHGFLAAPNDEYWLLSGAPDDPAEAINVTASIAMGRQRGIPELVFISDACRTAPDGGILLGVNGASIFPNVERSPRSAEVDSFYATHPGDPAIERGKIEAEGAHGLFTRELLDAHTGPPSRAVLTIGDRRYVRSRWLKEVLGDRVAARAARASLALTQYPEIRLETGDSYIAQDESPAPAELPTQPGWKSVRVDNAAARMSHFELVPSLSPPSRRSPAGSRKPKRAPRERSDPQASLVRPEARRDGSFLSRKRKIVESRRHSETALTNGHDPSLTITGDSIADFGASGDLEVRLMRERNLEIRRPDRPSQVAVRFRDGSGMLLPVLPEYACEIVRSENRTISISYTWLQMQQPALDRLRAEVVSAATLGLLHGYRQKITAFARRLRTFKRFDPVLGLVASLAYAHAGDFAGSSSVREYMLEDLQIDLFDSWALGGGGPTPGIVPAVPLLGQTWSLLAALDTTVEQEFAALRRIPGFWTVFDARSMDAVLELARSYPSIRKE